MVNENVFQVGCHMMPYVIQTGRIMMGTRGKKRGKKNTSNMNMTEGQSWKMLLPPDTHTVKVLIRKEEGLHAVKRLTP